MSNDKTIEFVAQQEWLGTIGDAVQQPVHDALTQLGPLKDVLHGKFLGHPLHPAVTDIPVGAWSTALVLDAVQMMTGNESIGDAADLAVGVGLAGAVASAVTGLTDWSESYGRGRDIGVMHGLLNVAATGLYTASLIARRGKSRQSGVAMSMLGYAIAGFSAYLGGHLVFGEQLGVDHTATQDADKPEEFTSVMREADLKERTPVRVMAGDVAVLLVRIDGKINAISNTCTHLGGPLNEGQLEGDSIRCPWHGSRFCLSDGEVLEAPATFPERAFDVRVKAGKIEVRAKRT